MDKCITGGCTKEGRCCAECNAPLPPRIRRAGRPRKFCSQNCGNKYNARQLRRTAGVAPRRPAKTYQRECRRCGKSFDSDSKTKVFCSKECRSPDRRCQECGRDIVGVTGRTKFCSPECRAAKIARDGAKTVERNTARRRTYQCINCGGTFWPKNKSRCAFKYCSRECAFDARRRRLPDAIDTRRRGGLTNRLASWFLSWGDDQWPLVAACHGCGGRFYRQRNPNDGPHEKCGPCRHNESRERPCDGCGVTINSARRLCDECAERRFRESRRKSKRAQRAKHGNACTFRQRCKKYGVPYTKVSRAEVMERDNWECQLCGVELLRSFTTLEGTRTPDPRSPTIDHIIPLSFGPGSPGHVLPNCQAACFACNSERGTEDADSFARRKATAAY